MQIDTILRPAFYTPTQLVAVISSQISQVPQAHLVAEALIRQVFGLANSAQLYAQTTLNLQNKDLNKLNSKIKKLAAGTPSPYVLGYQSFYGRDFKVTPATLIPRTETEELVNLALATINKSSTPMRILELATGSGCIAITLLAEAAAQIKQLDAYDISAPALRIASYNRKHLLVPAVLEKLNLVQADILTMSLAAKYDMIIANPPYITTAELATLPDSVKNFEPLLALDGGADGQLFYTRIASFANSTLRANGCLLVELDARRAQATSEIIRTILSRKVTHLEVIQDINRRDRILFIQLR